MSQAVEVDLDIALTESEGIYTPSSLQIKQWIANTLRDIGYSKNAQISVRVVDEQEIAQLNKRFRHKDGATNVLSFRYEALPGVDLPFLGDLVICASVVQREAAQQAKSCEQHWAHMVVHGTLHLLGYDHINRSDAEKMESMEINILSHLGFANPYGELDTP